MTQKVRSTVWKHRTILCIAAMTPLLMAARCNDDGGSSSDVVAIVLGVVDLVLSIISIAS